MFNENLFKLQDTKNLTYNCIKVNKLTLNLSDTRESITTIYMLVKN